VHFDAVTRARRDALLLLQRLQRTTDRLSRTPGHLRQLMVFRAGIEDCARRSSRSSLTDQPIETPRHPSQRAKGADNPQLVAGFAERGDEVCGKLGGKCRTVRSQGIERLHRKLDELVDGQRCNGIQGEGE